MPFIELAIACFCFARLCSARHDLQGEHVAPYLELSTPKETQSDGHPLQTFEGTPGLPQGCITYKERYSHVLDEEDGHHISDANNVSPHSRYVLLVRIHFRVVWKDDLILFMRAIMRELSETGLHMYLLIEDALGSEPGFDDTPEKFRSSVPPELQPIAFFYDENDIHNEYQRLHQFKLHAREYLPVVWFMHRYPGYAFAWYMEYDVRYTGPNFGHFLNAALHIALATLQENNRELEGPVQFHAGSVGSTPSYGSLPLPEDVYFLPDLVLLGNGTHTFPVNEKLQPRDPEHWNFTRLHHHQIQLFGMSSRLGAKLHAYARDGFGGHIEEFVPTLAKESGLRVVSVPIPLFVGDSFHCCYNASEVYYEDWYSSKECRQYALLHPIKLTKAMWNQQSLLETEAGAKR